MPIQTQQVKEAILGLNKFNVIGEINEGANAFAYRANHIHLNRQVFLKIVYLDPDDQDSILREPRLLVEALQSYPRSDNIVQLYDADILNIEGLDHLCLQMEFINGSSLLSLLQSKPLGQQEAVRICIGILNGLNYLHGQRLLHRDLKPANILLTELSVPKITDFGSMKRLGENRQYTNASRHSALYVPPEGWEEPSRFSFPSDIYQMGMVLYEMVNGCLVYDQAHYITPSLNKELREMKCSYEGLEEADQCLWSNRGIAELSGRGNLLQYSCSPRVYCSSKIERVIKVGTKPEALKRFGNVNQFLNRLVQIDVPDWKPVNEHYEAKSWQGFDWRVYKIQNRGKSEIRIERARVGTNKYRAFRTQQFASDRGAFKYIEDFRK